jgi:hypothetical protein
VSLRSRRNIRFCHDRRAAAPVAVFVTGLALTWPAESAAQTIDFLFPQGAYGYDQQLGVTVQTRAHPLYSSTGLQIDGFNVFPSADQSLFYNSNVNGVAGSGSWGSHTSGAVSAGSDWDRNSLSAAIGVDNYQYFNLPGEGYTNWNVGLGGGYTIGENQVLFAYSHQSSYQLSTTLGTVRSTTPVHDQTDSAALQYTFDLGRVSVTPNLAVGIYRFGSATSDGVTFNQNYLNYNSFALGATARYALDQQSGVLVAVRGMDFSYVSPQPGLPNNDSQTATILGGIEYQPEGVWRYRVLAGLEVRKFSASENATRASPDVEGSVVWNPTALTTVELTFANTIEAPQAAGSNSFVLTQGSVSIDHELLRNVFLHAHGNVQFAQFSPGGTQSQLSGGAGLTWLLNRVVHFSVDYGFITSGGSTATTTGSLQTQRVSQYSQNLITFTVHLAL